MSKRSVDKSLCRDPASVRGLVYTPKALYLFLSNRFLRRSIVGQTPCKRDISSHLANRLRLNCVSYGSKQLAVQNYTSRMQALLAPAQALLSYLQSSLWATSATVFVGTILFLWVKNWLTYQPPVVLTYQPVMCGDITLDSLRKFDGRDFLKPLYFAVRGKVFDVTTGKDFYGPGQPSVSHPVSFCGWMCDCAHSTQVLAITSSLAKSAAEH